MVSASSCSFVKSPSSRFIVRDPGFIILKVERFRSYMKMLYPGLYRGCDVMWCDMMM